MVARRAHNPEVVWFKSHLRNQKKEQHPHGCCSFLLTKSKRRTTSEPPLRVGWDRAAPNKRPRTHFRAIRWLQVPPPQPKKEQHPHGCCSFLLTKSKRRTTSEPPLRVGWDRAAPNKRPRTHFRAIRWLQVPPPQPKNFSDEVREGFTFSRNLTSFMDVAFFLQAKSHFK